MKMEIRNAKNMEYLNFVLPDFTRISWVSDEARRIWEPRIGRIMNAWKKIEWLSVHQKIRSCCFISISPEELIPLSTDWLYAGLTFLPLKMQGVSNYGYSSTPQKFVHGKPFLYRIVIGKKDNAIRFKHAWQQNDTAVIGQLLGYPHCCIDFFNQIWIQKHLVDTTWSMAINSSPLVSSSEDHIELIGNMGANILWRWAGIRAVPHLPCSFTCKESDSLAQKMLEVGKRAGYVDEMNWLEEILSWSVEWSGLHGIAEIKTPLLKISARTDSTSKKYAVRRIGVSPTIAGGDGLVFPNFHYLANERNAWYYTDNGFVSRSSMESAHRPLLDLALSCISEDHHVKVLDLGCGNGVILKKFHELRPKSSIYGVDLNRTAIEHARLMSPEFSNNFVVDNIFADSQIWEQDRHYDLILLMLGRLMEATTDQVAKFQWNVQNHCAKLLVYAYGDWLEKYGELRNLADRVGLHLHSSGPEIMASFAEFIESKVFSNQNKIPMDDRLEKYYGRIFE